MLADEGPGPVQPVDCRTLQAVQHVKCGLQVLQLVTLVRHAHTLHHQQRPLLQLTLRLLITIMIFHINYHPSVLLHKMCFLEIMQTYIKLIAL